MGSRRATPARLGARTWAANSSAFCAIRKHSRKLCCCCPVDWIIQTMPWSRQWLAVCIVLLAVALSASRAIAGSATPVLGQWKLTGTYAVGWGTAHPVVIYNGGVPSGKAWDLHWTDWGAEAATAYGVTWLYRPNGGYFAKPGTIELRAYRLGKCKPGGPPAYTRLSVRVAIRPGGSLGHWYAWGGWHTTCRFPS